jgi:hypothetical protein
MTTNQKNQCAHRPCRCLVQSGDKYCGQACKEAGSNEVEIACQVRPRILSAYRMNNRKRPEMWRLISDWPGRLAT